MIDFCISWTPLWLLRSLDIATKYRIFRPNSAQLTVLSCSPKNCRNKIMMYCVIFYLWRLFTHVSTPHVDNTDTVVFSRNKSFSALPGWQVCKKSQLAVQVNDYSLKSTFKIHIAFHRVFRKISIRKYLFRRDRRVTSVSSICLASNANAIWTRKYHFRNSEIAGISVCNVTFHEMHNFAHFPVLCVKIISIG